MTQVLYLSYDGMTDPLGQSQVIPYLAGLSKEGYRFHLVSFEKKTPFQSDREYISQLLKSHNIIWHPLSYTKKPPVLSTLYDLWKMKQISKKIVDTNPIKLIHCRSYISAIAGMWLKKQSGVKMIFDMRGFYADERVDGGLWKLDNPIMKSVYNFFKKKEKELLAEADAVVCLTHNAKKIIDSWHFRNSNHYPIQVIPCCADLTHFNPTAVNTAMRAKLMESLNLAKASPIISYLGAIGTWYMMDEMLVFFKMFTQRFPNAVFLFITPEPGEQILKAASQHNIDPTQIRVFKARRNEVPTVLSLSDASLFFIKPTFSKQASSPTKQGEIMGMGIPIICNSGVGDTDMVIEKYGAGILVNVNDPNSFSDAINRFDEIKTIPAKNIIQGANEFYSLEKGVQKYLEIYNDLTDPSPAHPGPKGG